MAKTGHGIPQHMCSGGGPKQVTSETSTRRGFGPDGKTRGTYTDTTTNTTSSNPGSMIPGRDKGSGGGVDSYGDPYVIDRSVPDMSNENWAKRVKGKKTANPPTSNTVSDMTSKFKPDTPIPINIKPIIPIKTKEPYEKLNTRLSVDDGGGTKKVVEKKKIKRTGKTKFGKFLKKVGNSIEDKAVDILNGPSKGWKGSCRR